MHKKKIIMKLLLGMSILSSNAIAQDSKWSYKGLKGPSNWGDLDSNYHMCKDGVNQSPINITQTIKSKLKPIIFQGRTTATNIVNNGHTVQTNFPLGNNIIIEDKSYDLIQVHFHTPSENKILGVSYPMEAHLVHADKSGNLAVVGVMFNLGISNQNVSNLFEKMPQHKGESFSLSDKIIKGYDLLPVNKEYYRFNGSLTTPPCSEGVKWLVMKNSVSVSKEQISRFEAVLHGKNNRPIQSSNSRIVLK